MSPFNISNLGNNYQVADYSLGNGLVSTEQPADPDKAKQAQQAREFFRLAANNAYNHGVGRARNARGYMGMLNGRIVKAYTHRGDSGRLEAAQRGGTSEFVEMKESANQLRASIMHHARNLGLDGADLDRIRTLMGLDADGNARADRPLLERKVMAQVVDIVNGHLKKEIGKDQGLTKAERQRRLTEADLWRDAAAGKATYSTDGKVTRGTVVYASWMKAQDIVSNVLQKAVSGTFYSHLPEPLQTRFETALNVFASQCFDSLKGNGPQTEATVETTAGKVELAVKNFATILDENLVELALGGDKGAVFDETQLGRFLGNGPDGVPLTLGGALKLFRGNSDALRNRMKNNADLDSPLGGLMVAKMERFIGQIATGMNKDATTLIEDLANGRNADKLVDKLNDYCKFDEQVAKDAVETGTKGLMTFFSGLMEEYTQGLATFKDLTKDVTAQHADLSLQRANLAEKFGQTVDRFEMDGLETFTTVHDGFLSNWDNVCQEKGKIKESWDKRLADNKISQTFQQIEEKLNKFSVAFTKLTEAFSDRENAKIELRKPILPTGFRNQTIKKLDQLRLTDDLKQQVYDHIINETVRGKIASFEVYKKQTFGTLFDCLQGGENLSDDLINRCISNPVGDQAISDEEVGVYLETFETLEDQLGALKLRENYAASVGQLVDKLEIGREASNAVEDAVEKLTHAADAHRKSVVACAIKSEGCKEAFAQTKSELEAANKELGKAFQTILKGAIPDKLTTEVFQNVEKSVAAQLAELTDVGALVNNVRVHIEAVIHAHVDQQLIGLNTMMQGQRVQYDAVRWYANFSERLQHIVGAAVESYLQLDKFSADEDGLKNLQNNGRAFLSGFKCPVDPNAASLFEQSRVKDTGKIEGFSLGKGVNGKNSPEDFNDKINTAFWEDVTNSLKTHLDMSATLSEATLLAKMGLKSAHERAYATVAESFFADETSFVVEKAEIFVKDREIGLARARQIARILVACEGIADDEKETGIDDRAKELLDEVELGEFTEDYRNFADFQDEDADLFDNPGDDLASNNLGVTFLAKKISGRDKGKDAGFLNLNVKTATPEQRELALGVLAVAHLEGANDAHFQELCDTYLNQNEDIPGSDYETKYRVIVAQLKGTDERADVIIDREIRNDHVGSIDNYKMFQRMRAAEKKGEGVSLVTFAPEPEAAEGVNRPADAPEPVEEFGQNVRNLFAEMLFTANGNVMDDDLKISSETGEREASGQRMATLLSDGTSVHGRTFRKLADLYAKAVLTNDKAAFEQVDRCFVGWDKNLQGVIASVLDGIVEKVAPSLSAAPDGEKWNAEFSSKLEEFLRTNGKTIESDLDKALDRMFRWEDGGVRRMLDGILAEVFPHNGEKTAADWNAQKIAETSLKDLGNNEDQNLKFVRSVLAEYLARAEWIDRRTMMARIVRTSPVSLDSIPEVDRRRVAISQFVALVHGAGPVLHKLLQSLSGELFADRELRDMINDVKSGLDPIPRDAVKATLRDLVEQTNKTLSDGRKLTGIRVESSLGAASVGEAFLCTMSYANKTTKMCVVKVLRPDAKLKANREAEMIAKVAQSFGSGVETTVGMKLDGILAELDLTTEAENIHKGETAYGDNGGVGTVRIEGEATANALPLAFVEGKPLVKRFTDDESPQIETSENRLVLLKKTGANMPTDQMDNLKKMRQDIFAQVERLGTVHKSLLDFGQLWEQKALKPAEGESGFYHGDLHAGNIMCSVDQDGKVSLTVLDYGNAVDVKSDVAKKIVTLLTTLGVDDEANTKAERVLEDYQKLLTEGGRANLQAQMDRSDELKQKVGLALSKQGTGDPVERLMALLNILRENFGLEVPTVLDRFIDSKLRLVNAVNETHRMLATAETQLVDVLFEEIRHTKDLPEDVAAKFEKLHYDDQTKAGSKALWQAKLKLVTEYVREQDGFEDLREHFKDADSKAEDEYAVKSYAQRTADQSVEAQLQKMQKESEAEGKRAKGPGEIRPLQVQEHSILGLVTRAVKEDGGPSFEIRRRAGDETATVTWRNRDWPNVSCEKHWPLRVSVSVKSRLTEIEKTVETHLLNLQKELRGAYNFSAALVEDLRKKFYLNLPDDILVGNQSVGETVKKTLEKAIFLQVFSRLSNGLQFKKAAELFEGALSDAALLRGRAFLREKLQTEELRAKIPSQKLNQENYFAWKHINNEGFLDPEIEFSLEDTYSSYKALFDDFLNAQDFGIKNDFLSELNGQ